MTTLRPAARAVSAASIWMIRNWVQRALAPDGDCLVNNRRDLTRRAEDINQIDRLRNARQVCIDRFTQDRAAAGVDRDDAIAFLLQIGGHEVAGLLPIGRQAHDGNGFHRAEYLADAVGILVADLLLGSQNGVYTQLRLVQVP